MKAIKFAYSEHPGDDDQHEKATGPRSRTRKKSEKHDGREDAANRFRRGTGASMVQGGRHRPRTGMLPVSPEETRGNAAEHFD